MLYDALDWALTIPLEQLTDGPFVPGCARMKDSALYEGSLSEDSS